MERFGQRWQQRTEQASRGLSPAVTTLVVSEQVTVMVEPEKLWRLVRDPATSPLVLDHVVSSFALPGTPAGQVGEMHIHIVSGPDGTLFGLIEEVIEMGPGYRAVIRSRSTAQPVISTTVVLPLDQGGSVLRHRTEFIATAENAEAVREEHRSHITQYLTRVRELAEAPQRRPGLAPQRGLPGEPHHGSL